MGYPLGRDCSGRHFVSCMSGDCSTVFRMDEIEDKLTRSFDGCTIGATLLVVILCVLACGGLVSVVVDWFGV